MTMKVGSAGRLVCAIGLAGMLDLASAALTLSQFIDCVGPNTGSHGSTCTLDPNGGSGIPWSVSAQINVTRHNITIEGSIPASKTGGVVLKRAATSNIMSVSSEGVTVRDLVFDGNKSGSWNSDPKHDLEFVYPSWNTFVLNSVFMNAPDKALNVQYYTYVQYCEFYDAEHVGILTAAPTSAQNIGIYSSHFEGAGANAIYFHSGAWNSIVIDSVFVETHKTCSWNSPGGQLLLDETTSGIYVQDSSIDGGFSYCSHEPQSSAGIEVYGVSHVIAGNTVKYHRWHGIYATAADQIEISYNTIESNGLHSNGGVYDDGIHLFGTDGSLSCSSSRYTIANNTIISNYGWGVEAEKNGCSAPNTSSVTLNNNAFQWNGAGAYTIPAP